MTLNHLDFSSMKDKIAVEQAVNDLSMEDALEQFNLEAAKVRNKTSDTVFNELEIVGRLLLARRIRELREDGNRKTKKESKDKPKDLDDIFEM